MCKSGKRSLLFENQRKEITKRQKRKLDISRMSMKEKTKYFVIICIGLGILFDIISLIPYLKEYLQFISFVKTILLSGFSGFTFFSAIPALGNTKTSGKDFFERIFNGSKNIYDVLKDSAVFVVCFAITCILCISSVIAAVHPAGIPYTFFKEAIKVDVSVYIDFKAGVEAVKNRYIHYKNDNLNKDNAESGNQGTGINIVIDNADATNDVPTIDEEWTNNHTQQEMELSEKLELTNEQKEEKIYLSVDVKNCIYFDESGFEIINWDDQDEINKIVEKKVKSLRMYGKKNEFDSDTGAPQSIKDEIAAASKKDKDVSSLTEKLQIISLRDNTYKQYPKFTLAQLIAEDYNACGLSIFYNGGQKVTAEYYFGDSIYWFMEMLKYKDISSETIKSILTSIAQRYDDIHYILDDEQAEKLSVAFRKAASNYGNGV